ncbi:RNA polymerase sporulation sigma factor SigH [Oscillospiraceae bacterium Marseille-Q3528]|nr:RNA polymerase sporulation sigma factor SigH [Oscillospiraceae bacterium Marseille-Q3528]WNV57129.1 RNA polymerase sporulation sigma factor SigH [Oscillospiraceae bacterium NTUH-002-81]
MEQYNLLSDEELISRLREGHEDIRDYLMEKHKNLVRKKARALYLIGGDNDDLIQEGMIGLYKAIRDFDPERGASFHTFADLCISRQLYTAVQASQRQKHQPLNSYVSLSDSDNEEQTSSRASYAANDVRNRNPEELFIARENLEDMEDLIEKKLSRFEREVLRYYLSGMNYSQIADTLGKSSKATDNALQRIKKKIKQITEN